MSEWYNKVMQALCDNFHTGSNTYYGFTVSSCILQATVYMQVLSLYVCSDCTLHAFYCILLLHMHWLHFIIATSTPPVPVPQLVITQATLGGALGVSVIINIIFVTVVVLLLIKAKAEGASRSPPSPDSHSKVNKEEEMDIEMNTNLLYGLTSDGIVTEPNVVYGVTTSTEPSHLGNYDYVDNP